MFEIRTEEWPVVVEVLRPSVSGDLVAYACTLTEMSPEYVDRECRRCYVRIPQGVLAYHDPTHLGIWHVKCFTATLRALTAADAVDRWHIHSVQWTKPE